MNKIPKVIHYCWFGRKEKPDIVKKVYGDLEKKITLI
jgi:mannosyltransferase OCH1-like enzyme